MSWLLAVRAAAGWQQGLPYRRWDHRLSGELSAGCKAKKQRCTVSRQTPILIQKEKLYTKRSVKLATGQEFRKGEKSSVKGTTKEVLP